MVFGREVLGEVIRKVFGSLLPVQAEFILLDAAAHPVELRVKGLGAFLAHVAGADFIWDFSVGLDRGGRLQVSHLGEGCADGFVLTRKIGRASCQYEVCSY